METFRLLRIGWKLLGRRMRGITSDYRQVPNSARCREELYPYECKEILESKAMRWMCGCNMNRACLCKCLDIMDVVRRIWCLEECTGWQSVLIFVSICTYIPPFVVSPMIAREGPT